MDVENIERTKIERHILQTVDSPFLVKLIFAFQTPEKLFFVMDFMMGGELYIHLKKDKKFTE